jgi:hypothetical protein
LIIVILGAPFQQFAAELISRVATDNGGTLGVFLFGGSMGVIMALMLSWKQDGTFYAHKEYTSNKLSRTMALLGGAFCWICFPFFNLDISPDLFIYSHGAISTVFCISASTATMVGFSLLIDQKMELRRLLTGIIAGGVIVGCSSIHIYNPLGALILGVGAGVMQYFFCKLDVHMGMKPLWSNGVLFLFVVQGFIGGIASDVYKAISKTSTSFSGAYAGLLGSFIGRTGGQIGGTFIALFFGALAGLLISLLVMYLNIDTRKTFYCDSGHWVLED